MKINANLIKVGNVLNHKDRMMEVLNTSVIKPGKGGAYIQVEMKDMKSGTKFNERWRTSDSVEKVSVNEVDVTFLYLENDSFTVMNNQNFEQMTYSSKLISGKEKHVKEYFIPDSNILICYPIILNWAQFISIVFLVSLE